MNKNCYRIIFNRQKGQLMVVSELANRNGCVASVSSTPKTASQRVIAKLKPLCLMVGMALGSVVVVEPAMAEIIADNTAAEHQQPQIIQHGENNQQIVNIQAPNAGGLSHNKYSQFDVDKNGVILNNSNRSTNTKLGGRIDGNANLANGQAKIILNEVNSRNPSQLNGFIEVAGQKAQVIIANPSGIACDGCGFINADKATLTTGKPQIEEGQLKGYSVTQGTISFNGEQFDSRKQDYTEIIARSVEVNAAIQGKDIKVVTGRNEVSADLNTVTAYDDNNDDKPRLAVDVSALGGMYAGKIHLVGTEKGVGVNNAGRLTASKDSIVLNADGKIVNTGVIQAKEDILVKSVQGIENTKQINSKKNVKLFSDGQIVNEGSLVAQQGDIKAKASKVALRGKNSAGQQIKVKANSLADLSNSNTTAKSLTINSGETIDVNSAVLNVDEDINLTSETSIISNNVDVNNSKNYIAQSTIIDNRGASIIADNDIVLTANYSLDNELASLQAGAVLNLTGDTINNDQANLEAEDDILVASKILSANNASLTSGNNIKIDSAEKLDAENIKIEAKEEVNIASNGNINAKNANITTDKTLAIQADQLELTAAEMEAYDAINVNASLINNNKATWFSKGNITITGDDINNAGSSISSDRGITLNAKNAIDNSGSELFSHDDLEINAKNVNNTFANLVSNTHIILSAEESINNSNTILNSKGKMQITSTNSIDNTKADISAADLFIVASNINNQEAKLTALGGGNHQGTMLITGDQLDNSKATLTSAGDMSIIDRQVARSVALTQINNSEATLNSKGNMLIKANSIDNTKADISATDLELISSGILNNQEAKLTTLNGGLMTIKGDDIDNSKATLTSAGHMIINKFFKLNNSEATLTSQGRMLIDGYSTNNSEAILNSKREIVIDSRELNNTKAEITAAELDIDAIFGLNNQEAKLTTLGGNGFEGTMTMRSNKLDNRKATFTSAGDMTIISDQVAGASNDQHVKLHEDLPDYIDYIDNSEATLNSKGKMQIKGSWLSHIYNTNAEINAANLELNADSIHNQEAKLTSLGGEDYQGTMIIAGNEIDNSKATLTSAGDMSIQTNHSPQGDGDDSEEGPIVIGETEVIEPDRLNNNEAILNSKGNILINSDNINNTKAEINAAALTIDGKTIFNQEAVLNALSGGMVITSSNNIDNNEATLSSKEKMEITSHSIDNTKSKITAANLTLDANYIINQEAELTTLGGENFDGSMTITGSQLDNSKAALISAGDMLITDNPVSSVGPSQVINSEAILNSKGNMQITSHSIDNTKAGIIAAELALSGNTISNQEAKLATLGGENYQGLMTITSEELNNSEAILNSKGKVLINSDNINNTKAEITAADLEIKATTLNNQEAKLTSLGGEGHEGNMTLRGNLLDNSKATLTSVGHMYISTDFINGTLDHVNNSEAILNSKGAMQLNGRDINNTKAKITAADLAIHGTTILNQEAEIIASSGSMGIISAELNNNGATLSSKKHTSINGTKVDNTKSKITSGSLTINADTMINQEAVLTTLGGEGHEGTMTLRGIQLDNSKATLNSADDMVIATEYVDNIPDELNNSEATLISQGKMEINTNHINNLKAKITASDMKLVANTLLNNEAILSALSSEGGITIDSDKLDNSNATLISAGNMTVKSNQVDNNQATLISNGDILIDGNYIDNMKANISAVKDLILKAKTLRNQEATLTANRIDITATDYLDNQQATLVGKESISINTDEFDNIQAKINTDGQLNITAGNINNNQSSLSAGQIQVNANKLENQDAYIAAASLAKINADEITNTNSTIYAGDFIDIVGNVLINDGSLFANNITINLQEELGNIKDIFAKNQLLIKAKQVSNEGHLASVNSLTLNSDLAKNATFGVIDSQDIQIEGDSLSNNGLINGDNVNVKLSGQFDNNDSARLYGNSIEIVANELNNKASSMAVENAPIIAAKQFLQIDANTLNNYNHALLLSQDNMFIKATTLNNHSARIESYTDMDIMVDSLNNVNDSITTEEVKVKDQRVHEFAPIASSERYNAEDVNVVIDPEKNHRNYILKSKTGAFKDANRFNEYNYNVTSYETKITSTAPAEIVSGNNLYVNAAHVNNTSSSILAGNEVSIDEKILNNVSTQGISRQEAKGKMTYHYPVKIGIDGLTKGASESDYKNTQESKVDFNDAKVENNASIEKTEVAFVPHWTNQIVH